MDKEEREFNTVSTVPFGSGFVVQWRGESYPASTAFIANKISNKITRQMEEEMEMRSHEFNAGRLNWKGASKDRIEKKEKSGVKRTSLKG